MVDTLTDFDWKLIINKIERRECTPFLGAGVSVPHIPLTGDMAAALAKEYDYPLRDKKILGVLASTWLFKVTHQKLKIWSLIAGSKMLPAPILRT